MGGPQPSTAISPSQPIPGWKWTVVWLMFLATMINYMDRQTMGSTSPYIMADFRLNEQGYGWVEFSFQISFALSQLLAGYVADRANVRWLYAGALIVWSAAGFFTGLAGTFTMLIACRVLLGFGEAFNWPCAISIVGRILPRSARSLANGIFHSGASVGAALTPLLVVSLLEPRDARGEQIIGWLRSVLPEGLRGFVGTSDWRFIFQLVGAAGLGWVILWFWSLRGERAAEVDRPRVTDEPMGTNLYPVERKPFLHVFKLKRFWIALTVSITVNVSWHFYRVWLPRILDKDLHFSPQEMLLILAAFFVAADVGSLLAGYVTRRLILGGVSVERARQWVMLGTSGLCLLAIPAALARPPYVPVESAPWIAVPLILVVAAGAMGGFANMFALGQEVSPEHTGKIVGIAGAVPWVVLSILSPTIGWLADELGTFTPMLAGIAFVPMIGAIVVHWWPRETDHVSSNPNDR